MKLNGFDLDQVESEARAIEKHRKHELSRGRKPPDDDTIRIPVALLLALLEKVNPKPSKFDFRLTTGRYVRPGCYIGYIGVDRQPVKDPVFSNPFNISAHDLTDGEFAIVARDDITIPAGEVTLPVSPYHFENTAKIGDLNLYFTIADVSLVVHGQTGEITHNGVRVGHVPVDSSGNVSIHNLTANCRVNHSTGSVVVDDVKVNG